MAVTRVRRAVLAPLSFGLPAVLVRVASCRRSRWWRSPGSKARPQKPRSSKVLTLALRSMNGVGSSTPFLITRTTPFFCQTNRRPSGANAMPTSVNGARVATTSAEKSGSANVSAWASRAAKTARPMQRAAAKRRPSAPRSQIRCSPLGGVLVGCYPRRAWFRAASRSADHGALHVSLHSIGGTL